MKSSLSCINFVSHLSPKCQRDFFFTGPQHKIPPLVKKNIIKCFRSVEESFNMSDEHSGPSLGVARKKKIAIGVIFLLSPNEEENTKFQDFFFSHFPLFESHMNKLKSAIEQVSHVF